MRVGIYGGSFDPIHLGHLTPVVDAARELALDVVVFVPAAIPPHKPDGPSASSHHRFAMTALALADEPSFRVSDFEVSRPGTTYTVDTLAHFRELLPDDEVVLVLGSDSLATFATWRGWREIAASTRIAVVAREPWDRDATARAVPPELSERFAPEGTSLLRTLEKRTIHWARNAPVTISSTWIRDAIRQGRSPRGALPPPVAAYLERQSLYQGEPPRPSEPSTT